ALQRLEDLRLLHHAPGQRGVERRQRERPVFEDFDKLSTGAEQEHRAELRIQTAADDNLVAFALDHRLHRDSLEVLRAHFLRNRRLNRAPGAAHRALTREIQLYAADIGL